MKSKWMTWSMAVALGLMTVAASVAAQEGSAPAPGEEPTSEAGAIDDFEDFDGLGILLAAAGAPEAGGGPGSHGKGGPMGPGMHGGSLGGMKDKLNLTDDQKSKLADIHDRRQRAAIPIEADLRIASLDLHKLMRADKPDARAIDAQIDKIASLRGTMQKSHVAGMLDVRAILTPAQQKLMRDHHGAMMGRGMRGGRGMHGGPGMHRGQRMHEGQGTPRGQGRGTTHL